jgi:hypothetical protein
MTERGQSTWEKGKGEKGKEGVKISEREGVRDMDTASAPETQRD